LKTIQFTATTFVSLIVFMHFHFVFIAFYGRIFHFDSKKGETFSGM